MNSQNTKEQTTLDCIDDLNIENLENDEDEGIIIEQYHNISSQSNLINPDSKIACPFDPHQGSQTKGNALSQIEGILENQVIHPEGIIDCPHQNSQDCYQNGGLNQECTTNHKNEIEVLSQIIKINTQNSQEEEIPIQSDKLSQAHISMHGEMNQVIYDVDDHVNAKSNDIQEERIYDQTNNIKDDSKEHNLIIQNNNLETKEIIESESNKNVSILEKQYKNSCDPDHLLKKIDKNETFEGTQNEKMDLELPLNSDLLYNFQQENEKDLLSCEEVTYETNLIISQQEVCSPQWGNHILIHKNELEIAEQMKNNPQDRQFISRDNSEGDIIKMSKELNDIPKQQNELDKQKEFNENITQIQENKQSYCTQLDKDEKSREAKSICEAPQTIASIFQQLASVFAKMVIPQSMVNMSLHPSKTLASNLVDLQNDANMQEQMNQIQNQISFIQNSVMHIPQHLQEVTSLLNSAVCNGISPQPKIKDIIKQDTKIDPKQNQKPNQKQESLKKDETLKTDKNTQKKKVDSVFEESSSEQGSETSSEESLSEKDDQDESEDDDLQEVINCSIAASKQRLANSIPLQNKKTSYIQPKTGFSVPKIITPSKSQTSLPQIIENPVNLVDPLVINAASIGFKESKLFLNETERIIKTDDLETEEESLKPCYDLLNKLESPTSFIILKELFADLSDQKLQEIIDQFQHEDKLALIKLFLPRYSKCQSARIDYYYADFVIPPQKSKKNELDQSREELKDNSDESEKSLVLDIQNFGDRKKYDLMTDEQLLSYQKELNLRKQSLLDKKQNANPTSDRIKKIQLWNEMKEVCSTVFEKIAVLKGKRITEICDDFGVQLDI